MTLETQVSLRVRACPICRTRDHSRLYARANFDWAALDRYAFASRKLPEYMHWQLSRCAGCDLLYADLAPRPEDLAILYQDAGFDSRHEARHARRTYGRLLARIVTRLPDRTSAADIGTGDGAFLAELLELGFVNVEGIEPSRAPIEAADPSIRPLIRQEVFREDSFAAESLSLITCFQTIEHLSDPLAFCRDAHRALSAARGTLSDQSQSSGDFSQSARRKSPIFDIEHLQLFSRASLRNLLAQRDSPGLRRFRFSIAIRSLTGPSCFRFRAR